MGKGWDSDKGGREAWIAWLTDVMRECYRVLRPGAHGLVWAIPRTSHWTATALENAGFEVRDVVTHLFGSGFPKSMDISKAIDAKLTTGGSAPKNLRRALQGEDYEPHPNAGKEGYGDGGAFAYPLEGQSGEGRRAAAAYKLKTEAARQWEGWGTALKPAVEFWWLIRKPLSEKTVAANVLKHGTGGINIDGCRIGIGSGDGKNFRSANGQSNGKFFADGSPKCVAEQHSLGRFPANLVLSHDEGCRELEPVWNHMFDGVSTGWECTDDCAVRMLDEQSGVLHSHGGGSTTIEGFNKGTTRTRKIPRGDSGGASRFFYVAKASKSDRGAGNAHPTVKSTKLMDYLVRLVTPPGGIVLDPFMGSGTTGVSATRGGFGFVGIEREAEYHATAERRIESVSPVA
jgi:hypothetical protein